MAGRGRSNKQGQDVPADVGNPSSSASNDPVAWARRWRSPTTPSPSSSERELPVGRNSRPHPYADTRDSATSQWLACGTPGEGPSVDACGSQQQIDMTVGESLSGEAESQKQRSADSVGAYQPLPKAIQFFGKPGSKCLGTVGLIILKEGPSFVTGESLSGDPSVESATDFVINAGAPPDSDVFVLCHRRRDEDMKISCIGGQVRGYNNHAKNSAALRNRVQHEATRHAWQKASLCLQKVDFREWSWLQDDEDDLRQHGHFNLAIRFCGEIQTDMLLTPAATGTMVPKGLLSLEEHDEFATVPGVIPTGDEYNWWVKYSVLMDLEKECRPNFLEAVSEALRVTRRYPLPARLASFGTLQRTATASVALGSEGSPAIVPGSQNMESRESAQQLEHDRHHVVEGGQSFCGMMELRHRGDKHVVFSYCPFPPGVLLLDDSVCMIRQMVLDGKLPIYFTSPNEEPRVHHEMTDEEIHYVNHLRLSKNDRQKQLVARIGEKVVDYNNLKVDPNPADSCHFAFRHSNPLCSKSLIQQKLAHFPNNGHTFVFQYFVNTGLLRSPVNNVECAESICDFEGWWPGLEGQTSDFNIRVLVYDLVPKAPRDDEGEQCDAACAAEMYETPMVSDDSIYYHGTHIRNVPSILYEGQLRPSSRSNVYLGDTPEGCHLTNEFEVAREFATRSRLHILDNIAVTSAREERTTPR